MDKNLPRALVALGLLLAIGMSTAALIMGLQVRHIGNGKQTISVKGLAQKPVKADRAEWRVAVNSNGATLADALKNLRAAKPTLERFLNEKGFSGDEIKFGDEAVSPRMVDEETSSGAVRSVQHGFSGTQTVTVKSTNLAKVGTAASGLLDLAASGVPVQATAPDYLVSGLEDIKMSLIADATKNAQQRASEFARTGGVRLGNMRSASQGAFYVLAPGNQADNSDYGGTYDKTTVEKIARVVVTIEYNIGD